MFSRTTQPPEYTALALHAEDEPLTKDVDRDSDLPAQSGSDDFPPVQPQSQLLPKLVLYASLALALLSTVNVLLLPTTLHQYLSYPFSEQELKDLPFPDQRLGLDRAAAAIPPPQVYYRAWPDRIVRVSRKLKNAVYGDGVQVYVTVEDSTIMRFPVPEQGNACAVSWIPPPTYSGRNNDLTTKGDISEVEVWSVLPSPSSTNPYPGEGEIEYENISYSTLPRGELLGVLDLTQGPNSTTQEFACPRDGEALVVEFMCQRVACHVSFMQIEMEPKFGMS
ncbi:hypothetical protein DACRYDRAFT_59108 [Dacryopinax primogenitus]|uniref:Ubiquitin 3 binding protein But2 C-terminal domain-containing protein n=1 Tax=Dacryopinax primogenitus (strain DJM 731) TaxID=1858805 RepID=M5G0E5_DACPD|nr:uncharacterized protein DACRYDRAFT_59108 [Dacryopinax primogenitus]EJT97272.1 hypothetical protein DACRYDRAFT_59108 [Dacryopinax primogenitus]